MAANIEAQGLETAIEILAFDNEVVSLEMSGIDIIEYIKVNSPLFPVVEGRIVGN
ncbi:MAG: hypothetical protein ACOC1W_03385 [Bacillota bacterium]